MASLNLSANGPSIKSSYQGVINGPNPSSNSSTYAQWALFSVQAPLANAFVDSGTKESVLKVQTTGDGELSELIEEFSEGRIQFAFIKVKDPNSGLPKHALIAWCGEGVPERTKGYFTSHLAAVAKVLHGYHVQITARSDRDLDPESIVRKVADASGAKYSSGSSSIPAPGPPPVASKPVFTPTTSFSGSVNPIVAARNRRTGNADDDGWGADAPQISRTQLEKVESAYKPTKVNMSELMKQRPEPSGYNGSSKQDDKPDIVRGAYQPIGKVDISAIRAAAQRKEDDRPTPVKGSYEPIGKVDIAAIRAKAQKPSEPVEPTAEESEQPRSLADRSAAFTQSERLTTLPKPKVAKKFGGSSFTGTKAPAPGGLGLGGPTLPAAAPVGAASRTFADQGGKTPAQLWAEKKAAQGGSAGNTVSPPMASPIGVQKSGSEWRSGYAGKSWAPIQTPAYGRTGQLSEQNTGEGSQRSVEEPSSPAGGVSALRDRFKNAPPISAGAPSIPHGTRGEPDEPSPPPLPSNTRPSGGFALPGLPSRPAPEEEEEEEVDTRDYDEPEHSPVRIAVPVARTQETHFEAPQERLPLRPLPTREIEEELPREEELHEEPPNVGRGAATAVAEQEFGRGQVAQSQAQAGGKRAVIQYDYEKAEDNEVELREGEYVTNIEMVDDDWWMGTNSRGESGLFPSNYVELVEDEEAPGPSRPIPPPAPAQPEPEPEPAAGSGATATALFDYEAAEDNELSFGEGVTVTNLEFPDEDWWFGHYKGKSGLFPANYVQLDS